MRFELSTLCTDFAPVPFWGRDREVLVTRLRIRSVVG